MQANHRSPLPGREVTTETLERLCYHRPFKLAASHLLAAGYRVTIRPKKSMAVEVYEARTGRMVAEVADGQALADLLGLTVAVGE